MGQHTVNGGHRHSRAKGLDASRIFAIGFGGVVGVAWIILLGNLISPGGPAGAIIGLLIGAVILTAVALCYGELGGMIPATGGEVVYAFDVFGEATAYLVGWTATLTAIAICAFEAVSLGWIVTLLLPAIKGPELYVSLGSSVTAGQLAIGIAFTVGITALGIIGTGISGRLQQWLIVIKTAIMLGTIALAFSFGDPARLDPLFAKPGLAGGIASIAATLLIAPFWFTGFNTPAPLVGEAAHNSSARALAGALVAPIWASVGLYSLLILSTSSLVPWTRLAQLELPAASVFLGLPGGTMAFNALLWVGAMGVVTVWNGSSLANSRYLVAMARGGFAPAWLARIHPTRNTPVNALLVTAAGTLLGLLAGKTAILPLVNMISLILCVLFALICAATLRQRRRLPEAARPFRVPGGAFTAAFGMIGASALALIAFIMPWQSGTVPAEWVVLAIWLSLALMFWRATTRSREALDPVRKRAALNSAI